MIDEALEDFETGPKSHNNPYQASSANLFSA